MKNVAYKYQQILLDISRYENGDVSDSMIKHGLCYKKNYGVSIPVIDKIATKYSSNSDLAFYLWEKDERECKLLSLRLFSNKVNVIESTELVTSGIENSELAEQSAQYFFVRFDNRAKYAFDLIKNNNEFCNLAGLILISKIAQIDKNLDDNVFLQFMDEFKNMKLCHSFHQKRGLARALLQIGLRNNELKQESIQWIDLQSQTNIECKNWLEQEVKYYLTN